MTSEQFKKKKIFLFRELLPEIKVMLLGGCYVSDIHEWAKSKGLDIGLGTFRNYLARENVTIKNLLHAKNSNADSDIKYNAVNNSNSRYAIKNESPANVVANNISLPEITSKADFKKLTQTSDIDLEPSKAKLEEAMRILGE